jgi:heme-degrading monooxygenase HmoA
MVVTSIRLLTGENIYRTLAPVKRLILVHQLEGPTVIARTWRGAVRTEDSDAYLEYLNQTGLAEYGKTPGNRGVLGLRRVVGDRAEFLLVSLWDSQEAIRQFAGEDIEKAVFYPEDEQFLIEKEDRVAHYEVVHDTAPVAHG